MTDETTETRTHAEIEAELYELVVLAKRRDERAQEQQTQLDESLQAIQQASDRLQKSPEAVRAELNKAVAAEAGKLRRSALIADWTGLLVAFMAGVLAGVIGLGWWLGQLF